MSEVEDDYWNYNNGGSFRGCGYLKYFFPSLSKYFSLFSSSPSHTDSRGPIEREHTLQWIHPHKQRLRRAVMLSSDWEPTHRQTGTWLNMSWNLIRKQLCQSYSQEKHWITSMSSPTMLTMFLQDKLSSTSTCGSERKERYCILSHLDYSRPMGKSGKKCFWCDSTEEGVISNPRTSHNITNIVYRMEPPDKPGPEQYRDIQQHLIVCELLCLSI